MCEPVEECSGEPLRAEDLGSLVEGQVGGDQYGATLVALAETSKSNTPVTSTPYRLVR